MAYRRWACRGCRLTIDLQIDALLKSSCPTSDSLVVVLVKSEFLLVPMNGPALVKLVQRNGYVLPGGIRGSNTDLLYKPTTTNVRVSPRDIGPVDSGRTHW